MSISEEQIEALARLAQLQLEPHEIPAMTRDLAAILEFAARLEALTEDGGPSGTEDAPTLPLRDDVVELWFQPEEAMEAAPESRHGLFRVPPVMGKGT